MLPNDRRCQNQSPVTDAGASVVFKTPGSEVPEASMLFSSTWIDSSASIPSTPPESGSHTRGV
ncbi:hypothetical protein JMJ77_0008738 [Colletotrichum scovillei]|uniref:Uncharacterized protein n=1 Tax=Colletotrichum scovillei TaxID=1209932 RepID=A0A9P7QR46_9PEZI|nr:hypothetical protein JMJ78_0001594 [Colletotrichum scovillei]KAG7041033.1 hypothetical protein JMJ77_0008738 [Colletotrichum scovillei]KAG7061066.1 hypothetical protein JMJ76_0010136 [Colletotrichum scovillei]